MNPKPEEGIADDGDADSEAVEAVAEAFDDAEDEVDDVTTLAVIAEADSLEECPLLEARNPTSSFLGWRMVFSETDRWQFQPFCSLLVLNIYR